MVPAVKLCSLGFWIDTWAESFEVLIDRRDGKHKFLGKLPLDRCGPAKMVAATARHVSSMSVAARANLVFWQGTHKESLPSPSVRPGIHKSPSIQMLVALRGGQS